MMEPILSVFTAIGEWFASVFDIIIPIFWTAGTSGGVGSLTFLGTLAVMSLGLAIILLILNRVVDFLQFRG